MENETINDLTVEDLNSVLSQAVDSQNHELIDWLLHSKKLSVQPTIHKQKIPQNPILSALKNNDVTSMLLLCHNSKNNELIKDKQSMDRCLEFASESRMWEMCSFLTDVIENINPLIPFKYALSYQEDNEALVFYDKIQDKADAFMCACLYGSDLLFDKSRQEQNIKINYDLSFTNVIQSKNHTLLDKFLNLYSNEINWLKHDYFVKKIIDTENVQNLKYILNHDKIKDNFNLKSYQSYFSYLIAKKDNPEVKEMLDYLVLEYAIKYNGIYTTNSIDKKITSKDKEYVQDLFVNREIYLYVKQRNEEIKSNYEKMEKRMQEKDKAPNKIKQKKI